MNPLEEHIADICLLPEEEGYPTDFPTLPAEDVIGQLVFEGVDREEATKAVEEFFKSHGWDSQ